MHTQLDTGCSAFGDSKMLDAIAKFTGIGDVTRLDLCDALGRCLIKFERHAKSQRSHDRQFVRGVDPLYIEGRIDLGITKLLRLFQHIGKIASLVAHLREDKISGAVDDACDPLDAVGSQSLAQRLDNRDSACNRSLEGDRDSFVTRSRKDLFTMRGDQCLVGRHDMLAMADRLENKLARRRVAANQFHYDIDIGIRDHLLCVIINGDIIDAIQLLRIIVFSCSAGDAQFTANTPADLPGIAHQHIQCSTTDRSQSKQTDIYSFQCHSSLNR